jgi:phosphohistidine phosphatase
MKKIYLLRHGEAQEEDYESDYTRRLTDRGKLRSSILADHLLGSKESIDYIITSGATRAKCTAEIFSTTYKLSEEKLAVSDEIYTAHDPWLLMDLIWNCSNSISSLLIVGHNPVISDLAFTLTGKFRSSMGKGSIVKIEFSAHRWEDIESSKGNLCYYKTFSSGEIIDAINIV